MVLAELEQFLFAIFFTLILITALLYVIFGAITVRRLRKNPQTKALLGLEFASGYDVLNVAQALAFPDSWNKIMDESPLSFLHANSVIVKQHTNLAERILGGCVYWLGMFSLLGFIVLMILDLLGAFN